MKSRRTFLSIFLSMLFHTAAFPVVLGLLAFGAAPVVAEPEMTDQAIEDKIDDELLFDPGVVSTKVDVNSSDGIITLTGNVGHLLAKERAARIAETVKGVRAVINRIKVRPSTSRTEDQIRRDVESSIAADPATESYEISVNVQDGKVGLTGTVDSYQERELVKTVAKGVHGVKAIDDQIGVDYETDRSDQEIAREIESALRWNANVDHYMVKVSVSNGHVSLSGTVGSAAEKRLAGTDAWVAGVQTVDTSKLEVEGWARDEKLRGDKYVVKSESELRESVKDAMLYDPRVVAFDIDVDAVGSMVTLRGEVDNLRAKRAAEQDARNTVGVSYVDNRLKVRFDTPVSDSEIEERIREALLRDPYVERFEITATAIDGTVHLYGTVDSYFERDRADNVASGVAGVVEVDNHLNVDYGLAYFYDPYIDDAYVGESEDLIDYDRQVTLKSDSDIKESIESEMWWSPFVDSNEVTVTVDDGEATLTGTVDTWNERRSATENAYEGGAALVDNDLLVNSE